MKKMTSKQIFTMVALIAVIVLGAVYFLVYKKYSDMEEATRLSNESLKVRVDSLKTYYDNEAQYLADMEPMKKKVKEILDQYPADSREEDLIMQAVITQAAVSGMSLTGEEGEEVEVVDITDEDFVSPIAFKNINMGDKTTIHSVAANTVQLAGMEEYQEAIVFSNHAVTYTNEVTYEGLKALVQTLFDSEYNIGISSVMYSEPNSETGMMNGSLNLNFYSVKGNGKEYVTPDITPYVSGTNNIFGNVEVEEED